MSMNHHDVLAMAQVLTSLIALVGGGWWCLFARRVMLTSLAQGKKLAEEIKATREALVGLKNKEILKRL